jgi:hypothetical protein
MAPSKRITVSQLHVGLLRNQRTDKLDGTAASKHINSQFLDYYNAFKTANTMNENIRVCTVLIRI